MWPACPATDPKLTLEYPGTGATPHPHACRRSACLRWFEGYRRRMTLDDLSDRYWSAANAFSPTIATVRGVHDYDDQLPRLDDEWLDGMADEFHDLADEATALDPTGLTIQERITRELLIHQCTVTVGEIEKRFLVAPIDPLLGAHTRLLSDTRQNTVTRPEQAEALLVRYAKVPAYLEDAMRLHRQNADKGLTPASASVTRVLSQLDGYLMSSLGSDPFLALENTPPGWRDRAADLVTGTVRPAFEDYRNSLVDQISPVARPDDRCGLVWVEGGEEMYADLRHKYTQLDETATDIHDLGLQWATEINATEWVEIGNRTFGLESLEAIFEKLHTDPSLRFRSEEEMLTHARSALERAWGVVDDWFGSRPETPCEVVPVPPATAPAMPPAYYMQPPLDGSRPGTYFLNTYKPEERDRFEYESIHFHEGIPGHHFDRSLASEVHGIPTFRRFAQVFAHTEGWGLYSERLADEMDLYSSDIDRLGMISADAWRAGRLVTDTGIHALGWSRSQAVDFLREWTPIGLLTIEQEVDRYIGMPGQALAYKMGQIEIMRLRRLAEERLGERFDIKGFHDTMLVHGAMPLPLLSVAVEEWVESRA